MMATAEARALDRTQGTRRLRVLVIDDEELVQWGFRLLLAHQRWAERCLPARDANSALELARRFEPQVTLLDVDALDRAPTLFVRQLSAEVPRVSVLLLSHADAVPQSTVRAAGATGFVSRRWQAADMLRAIRLAGAGVPVPVPRRATTSLSARQQEILGLIAGGATNSEIATRLYLSRHTVKQHTSALYRKLGVRNRIHAVRAAQRQGLIAV
jgi:DNA-binding NarL/FixJ family response regulator